MKKINIPIFACSVYVYGKNEKSKFLKSYSVDEEPGSAGYQCGNGIWIGNDDRGLVCHECVHLADWLIEDRLGMAQGTLGSNTELRAYITEWLFTETCKYIFKEG